MLCLYLKQLLGRSCNNYGLTLYSLHPFLSFAPFQFSILEAEWARMPSEWKFFLHSWVCEVHSKNSDCILSAFHIFGPILVAGPNVVIMLKTLKVHSTWKNIERHSKCILTALWLHSKYSYRPLRHSNSIRNILIAFEGESNRKAT